MESIKLSPICHKSAVRYLLTDCYKNANAELITFACIAIYADWDWLIENDRAILANVLRKLGVNDANQALLEINNGTEFYEYVKKFEKNSIWKDLFIDLHQRMQRNQEPFEKVIPEWYEMGSKANLEIPTLTRIMGL